MPIDVVNDVLTNKAQLLDVRSKDEWKSGHAQGAYHISVAHLLTGYVGDLEPDLPIYIYCASGSRAATAASYLNRLGYEAVNIGGLAQWQNLGGKVVR